MINIKSLHLLWNMVDGRESNHLYGVYELVIAELGLQVMKSFVPDTKRFRHEITTEHKPIFRSTLLPADKRLIKGSQLDQVTDEFLSIVKGGANG